MNVETPKPKNELTAEQALQIKVAIDKAIDDCTKAIKEAMNPWEDGLVKALIHHRIVNFIWFRANNANLHIINNQINQTKEGLKS